MKKISIILIVMLLVFSLAACGLGSHNDPSGTTGPGTEQGTNGADNGQPRNNHSNNNNTPVTGSLGRADMEAWIAARLSAIGGPSAISLFDGSSFDYTEDGFIFSGDFWTVKGVTASMGEIESSLDSQLSQYGFVKSASLLGTNWYIRAGSEQMGFTLMKEGEEVTVFMSHKTSEYNQEYIDAAVARMPDIIAGTSALDKLPENFKIVYNNVYDEEVTAIRLDGSWYFKTLNLDPEEYGYNTYHAYAMILQADGSYVQYSYWSDDSNPRWENDGPVEQETLDGRIEYVFDADGNIASISTYLQICLEYQEGEDAFDFFEQPSRDYSFSSSLVKTGTATVAGVSCVVATTDDIWSANQEFTYDPVTGILFKLREFGNNYPEEVKVEVKEFDTNPTSLGDFVQP